MGPPCNENLELNFTDTSLSCLLFVFPALFVVARVQGHTTNFFFFCILGFVLFFHHNIDGFSPISKIKFAILYAPYKK